MTTAEIIKAMDEVESETWYEVYGIRTQEMPFELGEIDHCSHVWENGEETDEEMDGICCTRREYAKLHADGYYFGEHIAIIAGTRYTDGEDDGEIIIRDPVVVRILA